jgi:5-methylcytosine-specific restriction endonuclease McrA
MAGRPEPPGWKVLRAACFAQYGRKCWRCGAPATEADHVKPVVLGGADTLANLRPSCKRCNSRAGAIVGNKLRGMRRHGLMPPAKPPKPAPEWTPSRDW